MSSSDAQPCCMCGVETVNRCSACGAAGISLFFCSREHQKLVWKDAHSKVCGSTAVPFPQPPLTAAEVEDLLRLADYKISAESNRLPPEYAQLGLNEVPSLAETFKKAYKVERDKLPQFLDLLRQESFTLEQRQFILHLCRTFLCEVNRQPDLAPIAKPPTPFQLYSSFLSASAVKAGQPLDTADCSPIHHRLLILAALFSHCLSLPQPPSFRRDFVKTAFEQVGMLCADNFKPNSATSLQKLMLFLTEGVGTAIKVRLWSTSVPPNFQVIAMTCAEEGEEKALPTRPTLYRFSP
ncbi:hypothetical protein JCM10213_005714 [Rhodosporidiobolus nylandii]